MTQTGQGAVGNLAKTGQDTAGAIGRGDVKGTAKGLAGGVGQTVGGAGQGVDKTVSGVGSGVQGTVGGKPISADEMSRADCANVPSTDLGKNVGDTVGGPAGKAVGDTTGQFCLFQIAVGNRDPRVLSALGD